MVFALGIVGGGSISIGWVVAMALSASFFFVVMYFSRKREFKADEGGARLAGKANMIAALQRLQAAHQPAQLPDQLAAFGISGGQGLGLKRLFMSHPPLDERIAALREAP